MTPRKGKYRPHSRLRAIVPLNFDWWPGHRDRATGMHRPKPLRELFAMRDQLRQTS